MNGSEYAGLAIYTIHPYLPAVTCLPKGAHKKRHSHTNKLRSFKLHIIQLQTHQSGQNIVDIQHTVQLATAQYSWKQKAAKRRLYFKGLTMFYLD
jgi:hypothetical protein